MADKHTGNEGYEPAIHWITREKNCARQETAARKARPSHADPTADEAISNIMREEKKTRRGKGRPSRHPRIGVWRWDDDKKVR